MMPHAIRPPILRDLPIMVGTECRRADSHRATFAILVTGKRHLNRMDRQCTLGGQEHSDDRLTFACEPKRQLGCQMADSTDKHRCRKNRALIRNILMQEWD